MERNEGGHHTDVTFVRYFLLCFGVHAGKYNTLVVRLLRKPLKDG